MKSVLIVDDHPIFLQGITMIINTSPLDIKISTATNLAKTKQQLNQQQPDLLLFDLMLPDTTGFDGLQELVTTYPTLNIAILSSSEDKLHIEKAIAYGVKGYLFKTFDLDELLAAIEKILLGGCYLPKSHCLPIPETITSQQAKLTVRQLEVLHLVCQGLSNKKIAEKLYISENTVKKHLNTAFKTLKVKSRTQAAQYINKNRFNRD